MPVPRVQPGPGPVPPGWNLHFPGTSWDEFEHSAIIEEFRVFFRANREALLDSETVEQTSVVTIEYDELIEGMRNACPEFRLILHDNAGVILPCMALAAFGEFYGEDAGTMAGDPHTRPFWVRLLNVNPQVSMRSLKASQIGKFISIKGTVVRVGSVKPQVLCLAFLCNTCCEQQILYVKEGKYDSPTSCPTQGCQSRNFTLDRSGISTVTQDWQRIRIQEIIGDGDTDTSESMDEAGRIPRLLDCELMADLVGACVPGDVITVAGEMKVSNQDMGSIGGTGGGGKGGGGGKVSAGSGANPLYSLYLDANSLTNTKRSQGQTDFAEFTIDECYGIRRLQATPNLLQLLVHSLCPSIYGLELVKLGMLLTIFGGCGRNQKTRNGTTVRGDPHCLIVGDPGLGKSQMLRAVHSLSNRGVYVSGNTATTAGLTVTLVRDLTSGDYALEAGALVLADQGLCCIDEFDKMGKDHKALLEAMEQQQVSVAKAGIVSTLPARASIIAAANPIGGHYNQTKTVAENLKMSAPLLSRFDLIFIILDRPDAQMDDLLARHVLNARKSAVSFLQQKRRRLGQARGQSPRYSQSRGSCSGNGALNNTPSGAANAVARSTPVSTTGHQELSTQQTPALRSLLDRIRLPKDQWTTMDPVPQSLLRKYIAYARNYVFPKLSRAASEVFAQFYLELRAKTLGPDMTPVTTRQLESLIRLGEARARVELRTDVTQQDAEDVVELMRSCLRDVLGDDAPGAAPTPKSFEIASGRAKGAGAIKKLVSAMMRRAEVKGSSVFWKREIQELATGIGINPLEFHQVLDRMNNHGFVLKRGKDQFKLTNADY